MKLVSATRIANSMSTVVFKTMQLLFINLTILHINPMKLLQLVTFSRKKFLGLSSSLQSLLFQNCATNKVEL